MARERRHSVERRKGLSPHNSGIDSCGKDKKLGHGCEKCSERLSCSPRAWQECFGDWVLPFLQPYPHQFPISLQSSGVPELGSYAPRGPELAVGCCRWETGTHDGG